MSRLPKICLANIRTISTVVMGIFIAAVVVPASDSVAQIHQQGRRKNIHKAHSRADAKPYLASHLRKERKEKKEKKEKTSFEMKVESLLGARVQTKHGTFWVRQEKDEYGRVRSSVIEGANFSERQFDTNGDGTVDYFETKKGAITVTASSPADGQFQRLVVGERSKRGYLEASYVLSRDSRYYNLVNARLTKPGITRYFDATPRITRGRLGFSHRVDESKMCDPKDQQINPVAKISFEMYQKQLFLKLSEDPEKFFQELKTSKNLFSESCFAPKEKENFDALSDGVIQVLMSSGGSGSGSSSPAGERGSFLNCLKKSGLVANAEKMQSFITKGMYDPSVKDPFKCEFSQGRLTDKTDLPAGVIRPALATDSNRDGVLDQAVFRMNAKDQGDVQDFSYANAVFHELFHISGVKDEEYVQAATACCGDPSSNREIACTNLDRMTYYVNRYNEIVTVMERSAVRTSLDDMYNNAFLKFNESALERLGPQFILHLDRPKPPAYPRGLLDPKTFDDCVAEKTKLGVAGVPEEVCQGELQQAIAFYIKDFMKNDCPKLVLEYEGSQSCKTFENDQSFIDQAASILTKSFFKEKPCPTSSETSASSIKTSASNQGASRFGRAVALTKNWLFAFLTGDIATADEPKMCIGLAIKAPDINWALRQGEVAPVVENGANGVKDDNLNPKLYTGNPVLGNSKPDSQRGTYEVPGSKVTVPIGSVGGGGQSSPLPVHEAPKNSNQAASMVDKAYRAAGDTVEAGAKGIRKIAGKIVPTAQASERRWEKRQDQSEKNNREFIEFRPHVSEIAKKDLGIPNTFGAIITGSGSSALIRSDSGSFHASGASASDLNSKSNSKPNQQLKSASSGEQQGAIAGRKLATADAGGAGHVANQKSTLDKSSSDKGIAGAGSLKKSGREQKSEEASLSALLRQKYRDIESRLNELSVQTQLVDMGVRIVKRDHNYTGKIQNPKTCYAYDGMDKPLRREPCRQK